MSFGADDPLAVLLVEDNPGDVRLTKEAFEDGSVDGSLHVVTDGADALDVLHGRGEDELSSTPTPDLVLLDLNLPTVTGREVLEAIESEPALHRVPVVVLTSSEAEEDVVACYEHGANAYLTKPVDPDEYISLVRTVVELWAEYGRLPPE